MDYLCHGIIFYEPIDFVSLLITRKHQFSGKLNLPFFIFSVNIMLQSQIAWKTDVRKKLCYKMYKCTLCRKVCVFTRFDCLVLFPSPLYNQFLYRYVPLTYLGEQILNNIYLFLFYLCIFQSKGHGLISRSYTNGFFH